jgi:hypothetical protein
MILTGHCFWFLWPCIVSKVWRERKPTRCNNQMFIINFCLNMFRASLCPSSGEQRPCVTSYGVLLWFCWMWLVAVVGRCVVGCEQCSHPTTQHPTTVINHTQQNQSSTPYAVTHGLCSPEDGHNDTWNMLRQKLIINIWLLHLVGFLSLHIRSLFVTSMTPSCQVTRVESTYRFPIQYNIYIWNTPQKMNSIQHI